MLAYYLQIITDKKEIKNAYMIHVEGNENESSC